MCHALKSLSIVFAKDWLSCNGTGFDVTHDFKTIGMTQSKAGKPSLSMLKSHCVQVRSSLLLAKAHFRAFNAWIQLPNANN
jgi:hypothetical protein